MELTLTRSDLDAMPKELRHQLLLYLEGRLQSRGRRQGRAQTVESRAGAAALERTEVAALLRDISFHRLGRPLRALLDRLSSDEAGALLTRERLAAALPKGKQAQLGRYVATLNRIAAKAAQQSGLRLCSFVRGTGAYQVHPTTRRWLRDLLPGIERAGEHEEPLWE
jgi:hypothetical protein